MVSPLEYLTQRSALEHLANEPASDRGTRRSLVMRARQKKDAAEATIAVSVAESLVLMRDAVLLFEKALKVGGSEETFEARCAALGVDEKTTHRLEATLPGLADLPLPTLETDVREVDVDLFGQLAGMATALDRALSTKILQKRDIVARRLRRRVVVALTGVATVLALYMTFRPLPCRASGSLFEEFRCDMAIDGTVVTEWLLPDGKDGWLDVRVNPSRAIRLVRLTNGHNRTSNDRAIRAYRVEAYSGSRRLAFATGEFPALLPAPSPVEVPLVAKDVDRVRLVVTSWFGAGAALAEIKVE